MKILLWIAVGLLATGVAFYIVTRPWFPRNSLNEFLVFLVFAAPAVGAFWMLYVATRKERTPLPMILLAFVPYAFLWHYFERVRPEKHKSDTLSAT
jgi:ABC-type transport system involved in cytochrome c biogenesis permease subunit